jgi:hypothetical protein
MGTKGEGATRRISWRLVAVNVGLIALILYVFRILVEAFVFNRNDHNHAALLYEGFDCTRRDVCRIRHPTTYNRDANGRAFYYRVNSLGFRGPEFALARPSADTVRVALFGDSRMFGGGVCDGDDPATALRAALSARHPGRTFEVMNFAMPASYLNTSLAIYTSIARPYAPDVAVFAYDDLNYHDIQYRLTQIRDSRVLRALMRTHWGRWLVNVYQLGTTSRESESEITRRFRVPLRVVAEDQRARGLRVVFWRWWSDDQTNSAEQFAILREVLPAGLQATFATSGLLRDPYMHGPYSIHNDGHPNAAGHRFFAERIADAIGPRLPGSR